MHWMREMAENVTVQTIFDWALRIATGLFLGAASWILQEFSDDLEQVTVVSNENTAAIREIQSNRYTVQDAYKSQQATADQLAEIRSAISEMERRIPTRAEFQSWLDLVKDLREEIRRRPVP